MLRLDHGEVADLSGISIPPQVPQGCGHLGTGQAVPVGPEPAGDTGAGAWGGLSHGLLPPRRVVRLLHGEEHRGARPGVSRPLPDHLRAAGGKLWLSPASPVGGTGGDGCSPDLCPSPPHHAPDPLTPMSLASCPGLLSEQQRRDAEDVSPPGAPQPACPGGCHPAHPGERPPVTSLGSVHSVHVPTTTSSSWTPTLAAHNPTAPLSLNPRNRGPPARRPEGIPCASSWLCPRVPPRGGTSSGTMARAWTPSSGAATPTWCSTSRRWNAVGRAGVGGSHGTWPPSAHAIPSRRTSSPPLSSTPAPRPPRSPLAH